MSVLRIDIDRDGSNDHSANWICLNESLQNGLVFVAIQVYLSSINNFYHVD